MLSISGGNEGEEVILLAQPSFGALDLYDNLAHMLIGEEA